MSVLFLSCENNVHTQDILLMQSLVKNGQDFLFACQEKLNLLKMAEDKGFTCLQTQSSYWKQFFAVRRYIKKNSTFYKSKGDEENIKKNSIDIIHVLDETALKMAKTLRRTMRIPLRIIASFHEPILLTSEKPFESSNAFAIRHFLAGKLHAFFVSSDELFHILEGKNKKNNPIALLPYSINIEESFVNKTPVEVADDCLANSLQKNKINERFVFLVDTALEEESGVNILLNALVILNEKLRGMALQNVPAPAVEFHICGMGSFFENFIEQSKILGVDSMIAFFGNFECSVLYENAHAIICPAGKGEGDFRSITKAWQARLPVISSDISPHTKLVLTGKASQSALIFPRDNAQTLAECMMHIIFQENLRLELIQTGAQVLCASYYENLEALYIKLLRKI